MSKPIITEKGYAVVNFDRFFTQLWTYKYLAINDAIDIMYGIEARATPKGRRGAWKELKKRYGCYVVRARMQEVRS